MTGMGGPRGFVALSAVVLIALGIVSGLGVLPLAVAPPPAVSPPTFSAAFTLSANGMNLTTTYHVVAQPKGSMLVQSITISWGSSGQVVYLSGGATGDYAQSRSLVFATAGTEAISVSGIALDGTKRYTMTTPVQSIVLPIGAGAGGCTNLCPGANSAFTASESGLVVTFTDTSVYRNATSTAQSWNFGDGTTGASSPITHTYAAAGSYMVTETVTATNATGASATSSSETNVTVSSGVTSGCQGTGQCSATTPSFITPTSGLFFGLAAGAVVWFLAWGRPEIALIAVGGLGILGFAIGMFAVGSW